MASLPGSSDLGGSAKLLKETGKGKLKIGQSNIFMILNRITFWVNLFV